MRHETIEAGKFITFEGGEGAGKSTQAAILVNRLARAGRRVFSTREPGGSPQGEKIREALLSGRVWQFGPFAEAVLFSVARKDHVESVDRRRRSRRANGWCATVSPIRPAPIRA